MATYRQLAIIVPLALMLAGLLTLAEWAAVILGH